MSPLLLFVFRGAFAGQLRYNPEFYETIISEKMRQFNEKSTFRPFVTLSWNLDYKVKHNHPLPTLCSQVLADNSSITPTLEAIDIVFNVAKYQEWQSGRQVIPGLAFRGLWQFTKIQAPPTRLELHMGNYNVVQNTQNEALPSSDLQTSWGQNFPLAPFSALSRGLSIHRDYPPLRDFHAFDMERRDAEEMWQDDDHDQPPSYDEAMKHDI